MRKLDLRKKTGFRITHLNDPVNIRDWRGKMFYSTEARLPRVKVFNLPKGKYIIESGGFKALSEPIKFTLPKLPEAQRNRPFPSHFRSEFGNNPNKCSIYWAKEKIFWDNSLKELSLPELYFILFHEFSHCRYSDEDLADIGAAFLMLKKGFNPSQIVRSPITSLSGKNMGRKYKLYSRMLNSRYES